MGKVPTLTARIALMGSGETAPAMVKVHRSLLNSLEGEPRPVLIDTTYGFQENADELTEKAQTFFADSLSANLTVASLRRAKDASALEIARFRRALESANYIFAGPGSPSYALGNLQQVGAAEILRNQLSRKATLCFASAAAVTAGRWSIPVYEIYKAGEDPVWWDGLDLLGAFGITAAVVPHFDNHEGATHDTRFCYIGDRRLRLLEAQLPTGVPIIGIDEHTCVTFDEDGRVEVLGKGALSIRHAGNTKEFPAGSILDLDALELSRGHVTEHRPPTTPLGQPNVSGVERFRSALDKYDVEDAMQVLASVVSAQHTDQALTMIGELDDALRDGFVDRQAIVGPLVEFIIELRTQARAEKDFAMSDRIRNGVADRGIVLEDTPDGTTWRFATSD